MGRRGNGRRMKDEGELQRWGSWVVGKYEILVGYNFNTRSFQI